MLNMLRRGCCMMEAKAEQQAQEAAKRSAVTALLPCYCFLDTCRNEVNGICRGQHSQLAGGGGVSVSASSFLNNKFSA